ncbi:MAG: flavodoxin [Chloroflexi bacterium]|nr:flavodoxin [Chloroflexota bacterium]
METKILVAYASSYGSTQEIAEEITKVLRSQDLEVDLQLMRQVNTLDGYFAVVLGAPLYMFHWHKDALHFLARHQNALARKPVAIFAGGPFGSGDGNEWQEVRSQLDKELVKFPWLRPVAVEIVGGRFDPAKLRFPYSLIPALRQMPASDLRDWEAIRSWANDLVSLLRVQNNNHQLELA